MKNNRKNRKHLAINCKADIAMYPFDKAKRAQLLQAIKGCSRQPGNRGFEVEYLLLVNLGVLRLTGWQVHRQMLKPIPVKKLRGVPAVSFELLADGINTCFKAMCNLNKSLYDFKVKAAFTSIAPIP
jgi:hypothetical protein